MSRSVRHCRLSHIEILEPLILLSAGVTDLEAFHADGQTFLTWGEDTTIEGEEYHVYRYSEEITQDNLAEAERLTDRWGPLDDQTSLHKLAGAGAPQNFVIRDLGTELSDDTGLFVYTTQNGEAGNAYYAVTLVVDGEEQLLDQNSASLDTAVQETVAQTAPILVNSINGEKGLVFTQFMDYRDWNPTFQGYAYNYTVALPFNYDSTKSYPLKVELHAYSEAGKFEPEAEYFWESIQLHVDDPGADRGTTHTWWYGFAADHDYQRDGDTPLSGAIENFTQQRVLKAIDEVVANAAINVDTERIHAFGHSMGGSGALSLGIHYGNVFAGTYSSEPMTDYAASPTFQEEFTHLWGTRAANLTIVNAGPHAEPIAAYGAGNPDATGVYDWLDHGEQLLRRRGEDISFLMFGHGKNDNTIDWETQGQPFVSAVEAANVAYSAEYRGGETHNWLGFGFAQHNLFSENKPDLGDWQFRNDVSYLAVSNGSDSGTLTPGSQGTDYYNLTVDWSTSWNNFDRDIVDTQNRYEISVRSLNGNQTADLTPRNLQNFIANSGDSIAWQNVSNEDGTVLQQGTVTVDADGLFTIADFSLETNKGSRLVLINSSASQPAPTPEPDENQNVQNPPQTSTSPPINVRLSDAAVVEGASQRMVRVTVDLDHVTSQDLTLHYATSDDSAIAGQDYVEVRGTVTILAGKSQAYIDIPVNHDDISEGTEHFRVSVFSTLNPNTPFGVAEVSISDAAAQTSVVADPQPEVLSSSIARAEINHDLTIDLSEQNSNIDYDGQTLQIGDADGVDAITLLQFDLPNVSSDRLDRAIIEFSMNETDSIPSSLPVDLYAIDTPWHEEALSELEFRRSDFVNAPTNATVAGTAAAQRVYRSAFDVAGVDGDGVTRVSVDITEMVKLWLDEELDNHGIALAFADNSIGDSTVTLASSEHSSRQLRPTVSFSIS